MILASVDSIENLDHLPGHFSTNMCFYASFFHPGNTICLGVQSACRRSISGEEADIELTKR